MPDHDDHLTAYRAAWLPLGLLLALANLLAGAAGPVPPTAPAAATIVYQNRYDDPANLARWSNPQTDKSKRLILGRFYNATECLSLPELPPHAFVRLKAQLLIMDSWDGNNPGDGPDQISIRLDDGRLLMQSTFTIYGQNDPRNATPPTQSFPDNYGTGEYAGLTAADDHDVNWLPRSSQSWGGNAVYNVDFTFPHTAPKLRIDFRSSLLDSDPTINNESWGLGSVEVSLLQEAPMKLTAEQVSRLVADLDSDDPSVANKSLGILIAAGDPAVDMIRQALDAPPPVSAEHVAQLIGQLNDDHFAVREAAQKELEAGGPGVLAQCAKALQPGIPIETESRLQQILAQSKTRSLTKREQRLWRVLEIIGSEKALALRSRFSTAAPLPDMAAIRQALKVDGDDEWHVLSVKISQVITLLNDPGYAMAFRDTATRAAMNPAMQRLRAMLQGPVSDVALKTAMAAVRDQRLRSSLPVDPALLNNLANSRRSLTMLLTLRQEAVLMTLNILE